MNEISISFEGGVHLIKTVKELKDALDKFDDNATLLIEFYDEDKDYSWYTKVLDLYPAADKEKNEVFIEAN